MDKIQLTEEETAEAIENALALKIRDITNECNARLYKDCEILASDHLVTGNVVFPVDVGPFITGPFELQEITPSLICDTDRFTCSDVDTAALFKMESHAGDLFYLIEEVGEIEKRGRELLAEENERRKNSVYTASGARFFVIENKMYLRCPDGTEHFILIKEENTFLFTHPPVSHAFADELEPYIKGTAWDRDFDKSALVAMFKRLQKQNKGE